MKYSLPFCIVAISFTLILFLVGCEKENPKTQNDLLKNKRISWLGGEAKAYEFLASGTLIAIGGDFPLEGYKGGSWESVREDGSFKIILDPAAPENYQIARMQSPLTTDSTFIFETFENGKMVAPSGKEFRITSHKPISKSHESSAIKAKATTFITRYAEDVYTLSLEVDDIKSKIKKIYTEGDMITTEVMVTNAKIWRNNPPIILTENYQADQIIKTTMTLYYLDGDSEKATFSSAGYRNQSMVVFEDAWF